MFTIYTEDHRLHNGKEEFHRGKMEECFECPRRAELIIQNIRELGWKVDEPKRQVDLSALYRIHQPRYLSFLQTVYEQWQRVLIREEIEEKIDAMPHVWSCRGLRQIEPKNIYGKLGYYSFDAATPITAGTWQAIIAAVRTVLTAQQFIQSGTIASFALTRPPGHHAGSDFFGGYCFCNNAAIAAEAFLQSGAKRVAILDVDYHHGNGTQQIFYHRNDVLFISLHGDPAEAYPYFLGYRDETGEGVGKGFNVNYPLPLNTDWEQYRTSLLDALNIIETYRPEVLVISLGVDTYEDDDISDFCIAMHEFNEMGSLLAQMNLPTLFVMEGGYYEEVGTAVTNVLTGFDQAKHT